jgi:hypothetical protein
MRGFSMTNGIFRFVTIAVLGSWGAAGFAETVTLTDGRVVELRDDGTYAFVEAQNAILIEATGCRDVMTETEHTDDFGVVTGYSYVPGFEIQYRVENRTGFPLAVRRLGTEFSRDHGALLTLVLIPNFSDAVEPGSSLRLGNAPHLFQVRSEERLGETEKEELQQTYGCSAANLDGQVIYIDRNETQMRFPEAAGTLDPLELLEVTSSLPGLTLEVR